MRADDRSLILVILLFLLSINPPKSDQVIQEKVKTSLALGA